MDRHDATTPRKKSGDALFFLSVLASWRSAFAVVAGCIALAGCSKPKDDGPITLQLNWKPEPEFGGFYAADFKAHGLDVAIAPGGVSTVTADLLGAGNVPFAIVSADEIPKAREQGEHVVALFAVYQ